MPHEYLIGGGHEHTERTIEIPIAKRWIENKINILEIGAVLPYFCEVNHDIVDPSDNRANIKKYFHEIDIKDKNILSISTIEHIGLADYGNTYININGAAESIKRIMDESSDFLISIPIGYNLPLDNWIENNQHLFNTFGYRKQSHGPSIWEYETKINFKTNYGQPFPYANLVIFLTKLD